MNIGLTYDLRDDYLAAGFSEDAVAEFDSLVTIEGLDAAIRAAGHRVDRIGRGRVLCERLVRGDRWDLVFNIAEGVSGRSREAQVPCLLEMYGIPYTFSDPLVCAVTLDKALTKRLLHSVGIMTAPFHVVTAESDLADVHLNYPLFAKPIAEGTGKGINRKSKISTPVELGEVCRALLSEFSQPVLVEEYLPGREFTTGILGTAGQAAVLGTLEVKMRANAPEQDYSYEMKEQCEQYVDYLTVSEADLREEVESLALAAYRALEVRDAGRADIRLDGAGRAVFMEINPLPGLNPVHSDLPMIATTAGMSYEGLIGSILESAACRIAPGGAFPCTGQRP